MKSVLFGSLSLCLAILLALTSQAQTRSQAQAAERVITNSDIVKMIQAGLSDNTIVLKIQRTRTHFDTSPEALIQLKKQGASQLVLDAILLVDAAPGITPAPAGSNLGRRGLMSGTREPELPGKVFFVNSQGSFTPLEKETAAMSSNGRGMFNEIEGERAELRFKAGESPGFVILMPGGRDSDFYSLYRLRVVDGKRRLPFAPGTATITRDSKIGYKVQRFGQNSNEYFPAEGLSPGEYAFSTTQLSYEWFCFGVDGSETAAADPLRGLPGKAGVYYKDSSGWTAIESHTPEKIKTKGMLKSMATSGMAGIQLVEVYTGAQALVQIPESRPTIYLRIGFAGQDYINTISKRITIVQFDRKKNSREIQTASGGGIMTGTRVAFKKEAIRECTVTQISEDLLSITPDSDLSEGEYFLTNGLSKYDFRIVPGKTPSPPG